MCLLYSAGELSLIEYGQNEILGTCRTEHMSPYLISVRINPPRGNLAEEKKMAYLVDKQTAKVTDLQAGVVLATVSHGAKIDWLVTSTGLLLCIVLLQFWLSSYATKDAVCWLGSISERCCVLLSPAYLSTV